MDEVDTVGMVGADLTLPPALLLLLGSLVDSPGAAGI